MMPARSILLSSLIIIGVIAAYFLPWWNQGAAGLSLGAYYIAEWTSLVAGVRENAIPLLPSLLLRLAIACWVIIAALVISLYSRLAAVVILLIGSIALLPPLGAFSMGLNDVNYQQQAFVALVVLMFVGPVLIHTPLRIRLYMGIGLAILSAVMAGVGAHYSTALMAQFSLYPPSGPGLFGFLAGTLIFVVLWVWQLQKRNEIA